MKYTAVFDFDVEPKITRSATWLGGHLRAVQVDDAIAERMAYRLALQQIADGAKNPQQLATGALKPQESPCSS